MNPIFTLDQLIGCIKQLSNVSVDSLLKSALDMLITENAVITCRPYCASLHGNALDYTAKRLGLSHACVFDMRHKILLPSRISLFPPLLCWSRGVNWMKLLS